jgi:AraC-like DNA-binding protein
LAAIASAVGYESESSFVKAFCRIIGVSPARGFEHPAGGRDAYFDPMKCKACVVWQGGLTMDARLNSAS